MNSTRVLKLMVGCLALAAVLPICAPTMAADLPVKASPAAPVATYNWGGFYVGASAGYLRGNSKFEWVPADTYIDPNNLLPIVVGAGNATLHPSGFIGGGTIGFNYHAGSALIGIEADLSHVGASKTRFVNLTALGLGAGSSLTETVEVHWLATVRGRVGLVRDRWLVFVTGGWAAAKVDYSVVRTFAAVLPGVGSSNGIRNGWTVGGGVEVALDRNWSLKGEYLYADLGSASFAEWSPSVLPAESFMTHNQNLTVNIIRLGLNYRFGGPLR